MRREADPSRFADFSLAVIKRRRAADHDHRRGDRQRAV